MESRHIAPVRVEEVSDMINHIPPPVIRYGSVVIGFFVVVLLLVSWYVRYPEVLQTTITFKSRNFSVALKPKRLSVISQLFVKNGQQVSKGTHIALFEAAGNYDEIVTLGSDLDRIKPFILTRRYEEGKLGKYEDLGDLQIPFQIFNLSFQRSYSFFSTGYYNKRKQEIEGELEDLDRLKMKNIEQLDLQSKLVGLAKIDMERQQQLFQQKAISKLDLAESERTYLNSYPQLKRTEEEAINIDLSIKQKHKELLELEKEASGLDTELEHSLFTLQSHLRKWIKDNVVAAPISGTLIFAQPVLKDEQVDVDLALFHIVPGPGTPGFLGIARMSQVNLGSVLPGQVVGIKVNSYPFEKYGIISGRVLDVGRIGNADSTFIVTINIPTNRTDNGFDISLRDGMNGIANIETLDQSVLESFLFRAKAAISR